MSKQVFSTDFYGKNLTVEVGELAKQANGSVLVRYDDTVILSTAVAGKEPLQLHLTNRVMELISSR